MPRTCIGESTSINAGVCCTLDDNDDDDCTARDSCALLAIVSPCSSRPAASPTRARFAGDVPAWSRVLLSACTALWAELAVWTWP
jgi:hypothetical protein